MRYKYSSGASWTQVFFSIIFCNKKIRFIISNLFLSKEDTDFIKDFVAAILK